MSDRAPYSRVYWSIHDDAKFDGIRDDQRVMGAWILLLVAADMSYPSPAYLLPTVTKASVTRLVEAGLVDLLDGHRYRIHGLDAERDRRRLLATTRGPDGHRTGTGRSPDGTLSGTKYEAEAEAEQSKDEAPREHPEEVDDGRADLEAYLLVTRRAPSPRQRKLLDDVLRLHDLTGPQWAAEIILRNPADPIGAVIEADKKWRSERIDKAKAAERKPVERRPRGLPQSTQEILNEMRQLDAARARGDAA